MFLTSFERMHVLWPSFKNTDAYAGEFIQKLDVSLNGLFFKPLLKGLGKDELRLRKMECSQLYKQITDQLNFGLLG
jgi:hypothetical protein